MAYSVSDVPYPRYVSGVLQSVPFSIPANGTVANFFRFETTLAGLYDTTLASYRPQELWASSFVDLEPLSGAWFLVTSRGADQTLLLHPALAFAIYWTAYNDAANSPPFYGVFYNSRTALELQRFYCVSNGAVALVPFGLYPGPLEPTPNWILGTGFWNDQGVWVDTQQWQD